MNIADITCKPKPSIHPLNPPFRHSLTVTGTITDVSNWITLETKLGIVCACLPTLLPLLRAIRTHIDKSRRSGRGCGSGNSSPNPLSPGQFDGKNGSPVVVVSGGETPSDRARMPRGWYSAALSDAGKTETQCREERERAIMAV